ncbi:retrotransposon protein, putative, ty1-copia subclass [Tanacetum coccineum]
MIFDNTENQSYDFQADEDNVDPVENLNKAMMLLTRSFTQQYSTPTNNRLKTSSSTHNQAYMQGGKIYVHGNGTRNVGYAGKNVRNAGNAPQNVGYVGNMERRFLTAKGRGSGNFVKEKGPSMDDGLDVGNGGEASGSVTSNVGNSPSLTSNVPNSISFATKVKGNMSQKTVNFRPFFTPASNGVDVLVPKESVSVVNERLNNTVYGFFLGKGVAYLFGSKEGMEAMLESGPWLIRNVSLILKRWTPNANIMKEDVCNIHVWVKFHDVPINAFTEDGLSAIATKLGRALMLDYYMNAMFTDSWGRASYVRSTIELKVDLDLRDTIVVGIPKFIGEGFTTSTIHFEYEWAPPRCSECKNSKMLRQPARGPLVGLKPKSIFVYRFVSTKKAVKPNGNPKVQTANKATTPNLNSFDALKMLDGKLLLVDEHGKQLELKVTNEASASKLGTSIGDQLVESDEDEVELPDDEISRYMSSTGGGGICEDDLDFYDRYEAHGHFTPLPKKAGIVITEEDNDFLADIMFDEEQEELNATCIMMARIQEVNNDSEAGPSYDTNGLSKTVCIYAADALDKC